MRAHAVHLTARCDGQGFRLTGFKSDAAPALEEPSGQPAKHAKKARKINSLFRAFSRLSRAKLMRSSVSSILLSTTSARDVGRILRCAAAAKMNILGR
jgi:hypothetical protein